MGFPQGVGGRVILDHVTAVDHSGSVIIDNLNLTLPNEGIVMIRTRDDAVRSLLVELVAGFCRPKRGHVLVGGTDAQRVEARAARRVVRATPALFPAMTPRQHVSMMAATMAADVESALRRIGWYHLGECLDRPASDLSPQTASELWVVMCTLGEFDIVLLDEPFVHLTTAATHSLQADVAGWRAEQKLVIIMSEEVPPGINPDVVLQLSPKPRNAEPGRLIHHG